MSRRVGFGGERAATDHAERPARTGNTAPRTRPRSRFRLLLPPLMLCVMAGGGLILIRRGFETGDVAPLVFGIVWSVALFSLGVQMLVRRVFRLDRPRERRRASKDHHWTLDGEER